MDIFEEMERMHKEMEKNMETMFGSFGRPKLATKALTKYRTPVTDLYETENNVIATFEIPGVDKKDIELNVTDNHVEVKVAKKAEKEIKKKSEYRYTAETKSFYRAFTLPCPVSSEKTKAEFKNGVLRLEMPKQKVRKGKKIQIK